MGKRAVALDVDRFAILFFAVMRDETERKRPLDNARLLEIAMYAFENRREQAEAFRTRFLGLMQMLNSEKAGGYIENKEGKMVIHPALLEAASKVRTRHNGTFPERTFFEAVERIAGEHYRDFDPGA